MILDMICVLMLVVWQQCWHIKLLCVHLQVIFGILYLFLIGRNCVAAHYLFARTLSFVIAGQVNKRSKYSKATGPIMHIPLFFVIFEAIQYLMDAGNISDDYFHFYFIFYTTFISTISTILDIGVVLKYLVTGKIGTYNNVNKSK